jgi:peptidylprolyl isomerase
MNTAAIGNNVKIHYKGTLNDGTEFDNSRNRDETLDFELGSGNMIPGFEKEVIGMKAGQTKEFKITCADAYGDHNPDAIVDVPLTFFPEGSDLSVGSTVHGKNDLGQPLRARILSVGEEDVSLDHNHPLAGQDLNFQVELVEVQKA